MKNNRKGTPDIMSGLMLGSPAIVDQEQVNQQAIKHESNKAAFPDNLNMFHEPVSNKAIKPASNKTLIAPVKEKTTFNLSMDTIDSLEEACFKLKRKLKDGQRITKTLIVEKALELALSELEAKNELSDLYLKLKD